MRITSPAREEEFLEFICVHSPSRLNSLFIPFRVFAGFRAFVVSFGFGSDDSTSCVAKFTSYCLWREKKFYRRCNRYKAKITIMTVKVVMAKVNPKFKVRKPKLSAKVGIPICNALKKKSFTGPAGNKPLKKWDRTEPMIAPKIITKIVIPTFLLAIIK